jgi:hypothetical protein
MPPYNEYIRTKMERKRNEKGHFESLIMASPTKSTAVANLSS